MNWEAVDAVAQIIGVVVVVITLIYLAAQVRQGNRVAKSQARHRMIEQTQSELYAQIADLSITRANVKDERLTEDEQTKLSLFLVSFMRQREWEWFQYQDGVIDENVYRSYHQVIAIHVGTRRGRKWWKAIGRYAFDAKFVAEVDQLLQQAEPTTYLKDMGTWDDADDA